MNVSFRLNGSAVDADVPGSKRLSFIGTDWYEIGTRQGEAMVRALQGRRGKVALLGLIEQSIEVIRVAARSAFDGPLQIVDRFKQVGGEIGRGEAYRRLALASGDPPEILTLRQRTRQPGDLALGGFEILLPQVRVAGEAQPHGAVRGPFGGDGQAHGATFCIGTRPDGKGGRPAKGGAAFTKPSGGARNRP